MVTRLQLKDQKFGRLTVIEPAENCSRGTTWLCGCECGNKKIVPTVDLRMGDTRSCGCLEYENQKYGNLKHGHALKNKISKEYIAWARAKSRCFNPNDPKFMDYGGRGITMCDEWCNSFSAFYEDMGSKPNGCSIERIDTNGNYEPSNCMWADRYTQARNRRNNICVEIDGAKLVLREVATKFGVIYGSLWAAVVKRGENPVEAAKRLRSMKDMEHWRCRRRKSIAPLASILQLRPHPREVLSKAHFNTL